MAFLGEHAEENGIHRVTVPFTPSRKNRPAYAFLESIPDGAQNATALGNEYSFEAKAIQGMRWKPSQKSEVGEPRTTQAEPAQRGFLEFNRIARDLLTLREHTGGLSGQALAQELVRRAARVTAGIGAAAGALASVEFAAPPTLLAAPVQVTAENK